MITNLLARMTTGLLGRLEHPIYHPLTQTGMEYQTVGKKNMGWIRIMPKMEKLWRKMVIPIWNIILILWSKTLLRPNLQMGQ